MNQSITPKQTVKKKDPELFLAIFFIILSVLIVAITAFLVVRTILPPVSTPEQNTSDEPNEPQKPNDSEPDEPDDPIPSVPVFSGGAIPALPFAGEGMQTLTDELTSEHAVLVDAATGAILASKGHDVRFNPASMTKVMTLIVLCEALTEADLDREMVMTTELREYVTTGAYKDSGCFGFTVGDKIKIRDLLYGIGVESDADCTMLAVHALYAEDPLAVAEQKLVAMMNQKVQSIGLQNTKFDNVIGHESDSNYTTAADMAAIMMYALDCPLIVDILSAKTHAFHIQRLEPDGETYARWKMTYFSSLFNNGRGENQESSRVYAYEKKFGTFSLNGATLAGGKTGTLGIGRDSDPWIFSLVSFAKTADGKTYIAVTGMTPNAYEVMKDAKTLYDGYVK